MSNKLFEAFKAISSSFGLEESKMNEKAFEVDKEGIEEMEKFVDVDENGTDDNDFSLRKFDDIDEVEVFDDRAPVEERKPEDHVGQAILECSICHSNVFRNKDEVEVNEEGTLADEGKECPYCGNPDGYYVVGMVEPFTTGEEEETEEKEEVKETEDGEEVEEKEEEKEEVEESLTESKDCAKEDEPLNELLIPATMATTGAAALGGAAVGALATKVLSDSVETDKDCDEKKKGAVVEAVKSRHIQKMLKESMNDDAMDAISRLEENARAYMEDGLSMDDAILSAIQDDLISNYEINAIAYYLGVIDFWEMKDQLADDLYDELRDRLSGENESLKESRRNKMAVKKISEALGKKVKSRHLCKDNLTEAPVYGLDPRFDARKSFYGKAQVDVDGDRQTLYSYNTKVAEIKDGKVTLFPAWNYSQTTLRHVKDFLKQNGFKADSSKQISADYGVVEEALDEGCNGKKLKEDDQAANVVDKYQEWVDYDMKKYGRISGITKNKLDKAGFEVVKDDHGDYEVIAKDKKELGESLDKVEVETENEKITVTSEPKETVVETEKVEVEAEPEEIVGEVTEEEADKMVDREDEDTVDIEEVDTETLDQANESYLKENYSNVRSYRTTSVKELGGKLVVEGLITFASGNKKKTSFIYEASQRRNNKVRFIGENKQIAAGKKAFRLNTKLDEGKIITESLNYKYTIKDGDKSAVVNGTARPKRK